MVVDMGSGFVISSPNFLPLISALLHILGQRSELQGLDRKFI